MGQLRSPLLVYVDHTVRFERNTGIQRCVRSLTCAWLQIGVPLQPVVWDRSGLMLRPASKDEKKQLACWDGPPPELWAQSEQIVKTDWLLIPELVCGPHNPTAVQLRQEARRLGLKISWLFHDAIPIRWSHFYGAQAVAAASAHATYMSGLAKFELVLANSQTTAIHLHQFWRKQHILPRARLQALPLATELPEQERLPPPNGEENLVLCVSSLEPRKNHQGLLKSLAYLVAQGRWPLKYTLVLVGWANNARVVQAVQRAVTLGLPVRWEQNVDDHQLLELYRQSVFSVYPSFEEGFGLPVAESLWHRRLCLCSGLGALGELASEGGCFTVDTSCWREVSLALDKLLHNDAMRKSLQDQITQRKPRLWREVALDWLYQLQVDS